MHDDSAASRTYGVRRYLAKPHPLIAGTLFCARYGEVNDEDEDHNDEYDAYRIPDVIGAKLALDRSRLPVEALSLLLKVICFAF